MRPSTAPPIDPVIVTGRPSSRAAVARSPATIASRIVELRTSWPSRLNVGTTTTRTRRAARARRASPASRARSNPNAASGVIRKPVSATRARIRSTKASYGVSRSGLVERLDDGDRDAGRPEPLEPLAGVEQERRRLPHQDLVGVVVEGDDRRSGVARRRLRDEMLEQVGVPEVQAVEDADDDEDRPELRAELIDALDDVHRASGDGTRRLAGATKTLSGASRPAARRGDRHERAVGSREPVVIGRAGQAAGRVG